MSTFLLVLIIIGILILVHEWGHFYTSLLLGIKVEEFGFGFPPKIFSWTKRGVKYSINLLPFGGFVKIFGEHGEGEEDPKSFVSRPPWQRFLVLGAGVLMNLALAWVFFSFGAAWGVPRASDEKTPGVPVSVIAVIPNSPAEKAGFRFGDQILEMRSKEISFRVESENDVRDFVDGYRGEELSLIISRNKEILEIKAVPRVNFPEGEGPLGIAMARIVVKSVPWYLAPVEGAKTLFRGVIGTVNGLGFIAKEFFLKGSTSVAVSGPIGIFFLAHDTKSMGLAYFIQFAGILSVNLAVLNFLPIPALDGGRILFLAFEKIKGRRIDPVFENTAHTVGFVFLIILMVLVTYKDVVNFF